MKKNVRMLILSAVLLTGVVGVTMYSCEKETIVPNANTLATKTIGIDGYLPDIKQICGKVQNIDLVDANLGRSVGRAYVYNDKKNFFILLHTNEEIYMKTAYLDAQTSIEEIPQSGGGFIMNDFTYNVGDLPATNIRRFKIPISEVLGKEYLACAVKLYSRTDPSRKGYAWVKGKSVGSGMVFRYNMQECLSDNYVSADELPVE
ncbi:MAG: hypothetical protein EP305_02855 [Bacteroidetes bacterium]|nr:MAG: hypothetical protein EP305_02855 [Bacteroidota bacterium]